MNVKLTWWISEANYLRISNTYLPFPADRELKPNSLRATADFIASKYSYLIPTPPNEMSRLNYAW